MRGRPCSCARSQLGPSRRAPRRSVQWPNAGCQLSQSALGCVMQFRACACCTPMGIAHVCGLAPGTPPLIPTIGHCTRVRFTARHPPLIPTIAGARALAELSHTSARLRLPLSAPSAESCWRVEHWTPRRASRSGVVAPDAAMPWCVRVCQRAAWPSLKNATSNRLFVIRADKGGSQRVLRLRMHRTSAHRKRYSTF